MAQILKQSTSVDVRLGPFVDVGDGFTPETGVTIAASDEAEILKANGAATVAMSGAFAAVTGCDGWYDYTLAATDVDTVGDLTIVMQDDSVYLPVHARFQVVEEEVYDDLFAASAVGYLKPVTAGRDVDVTATGAVGIDWGNIENPTTVVDLSGTDINLVDTATAVTNDVGITATAVDNIWDEDIEAAHGTDATAGFLLRVLGAAISNRTNNANLNALLGVADTAGTDLPEQVWSETARILTASTNFNDLSAAEVNAQVDTALSDIGLDHLLSAAVVGTDVVDNSVVAYLVSSAATADWDTFVNTTDSLQAIRDTAPLGTAMRGTDSAALASVCTEARLAELDAANIPADVDAILTDTADMQPKLGTPAGASISADIATVDTNVDAILADTGTDGVVVASINTDALDAVALAADAANEIADALLARNIAGGSSSGRIVTDALRFLRNRWAISGGTLTVYQENDTTSGWTAAVTTTAADPISEVDPA